MEASGFDFEKQIAELETLIAELKKPEKRAEAKQQGIDLEAQLKRLDKDLNRAMTEHYARLTPWEKTQLARHKNRPYAFDYFRMILDDYFELSGDRLASNDEAVVGGFARLDGTRIVVLGQQKGRDLKERQRRNFGSARAEGFRKACRLAELAEKFEKPLVSIVDTAGAAADLRAEQYGVSRAIAENLRRFSILRTPIVVVIIGEGGSGGALGMAVGDRVLMLEHAIYSVISPEGCAAILWRDKERAAEAAEALNLTSSAAKRLGVVDEVLPEPLGGANRDPAAMAQTLKAAISRRLAELGKKKIDKIVEERYKRLRSLGDFTEVSE